jgi:hypothetical protein
MAADKPGHDGWVPWIEQSGELEVDAGPERREIWRIANWIGFALLQPIEMPQTANKSGAPQFERQIVPAKKIKLADNRTPRIRETAREIGADNDHASFGRAFEQVVLASEPKKKSVERWNGLHHCWPRWR